MTATTHPADWPAPHVHAQHTGLAYICSSAPLPRARICTSQEPTSTQISTDSNRFASFSPYVFNIEAYTAFSASTYSATGDVPYLRRDQKGVYDGYLTVPDRSLPASSFAYTPGKDLHLACSLNLTTTDSLRLLLASLLNRQVQCTSAAFTVLFAQ